MPDELRLSLAFALALGLAVAATPFAIRLARRTAFLDKPADYKGHARPTPYLGGAAVMVAFLPVALALGITGSKLGWVLAGALLMSIVGTIDDRVLLRPLPRLLIEAGVAAGLWVVGIGWSAFNSDVAGLALTIVWIVGLVNAFNLMDNLDGATATVGMVCAAGAAAAAAVMSGGIELAAVALTMSGACAGFLVYNLKRPARIFLGDGGSMPIGFLVAVVVMDVARVQGGLGAAAVVAAAPVAGLPILDTTLVMMSRFRRGVPLLSGGRDHVTHRLMRRLGTPQRVAVALAVIQAALCALGIALIYAGMAVVLTTGIAYIALGAVAIMFLDWSPAFRPEWSQASRSELDAARAEPAVLQPPAQQETS